jgi:hypothetical protein
VARDYGLKTLSYIVVLCIYGDDPGWQLCDVVLELQEEGCRGLE